MPTQITIDDDMQILVELNQGKGRGVIDVARGRDVNVAEKSEQAFNHAMATIHSVAKRTAGTIRALNVMEQPDTVELTFGLTLTAEANAFIASAETKANIEVKLVWNNTNKKQNPSNESDV